MSPHIIIAWAFCAILSITTLMNGGDSSAYVAAIISAFCCVVLRSVNNDLGFCQHPTKRTATQAMPQDLPQESRLPSITFGIGCRLTKAHDMLVLIQPIGWLTLRASTRMAVERRDHKPGSVLPRYCAGNCHSCW